MGFKFENLDVWKRSLEFSFGIHEMTKSFPKEELYVLTSQIKRAADSVVLNIAEGSTGQSNAEFKQFLNYAMRSAIEVVACPYVAQRRALIKEKQFKGLYGEADEICKMLQGLRKSLR